MRPDHSMKEFRIMRAIAIGAGVGQSPFISMVRSLGVKVLAMDDREDAEGFKYANNRLQN